MLYRHSRLRETTTKSGLGPTFTVTSSVDFWTSTRELRQFSRMPSMQLIQIYDGIFGFRLKCRVEILAFERGRQSRVLDRPLLLLVQLCFGLRRENLEIFADAIHASIKEQLKCRVEILAFERGRQSRVLDRPLLLLVQLCFGLRRENLEIFADAIHASINEQLIQIYNSVFGCGLKCRVGIVGFGRRQQIRVLDRPLLLLVQLCFGLRRENLEIFADAIHASINEQLIQIYDGIFGFRHKCRSRLRETTKNSGLGLTFPVTTSVDFGLRRENLEIFVDAIHAINSNIRRHLWFKTQMQSRESRLRETTKNSGLGLTFTVTSSVELWTSTRELRNFPRMPSMQIKMLYRHSRLRETTTKSGLGPTFTVTSSVDFWTSTRELRNFRGCHPCKHKCRLGILGFERRQQSQVLDRTLQLLVQLCFGLRRENLEIFADAIHASINEQLIQIYDGIFGFILKCRVGILGFERRRQSRVLDRPLQLLVQLSCGLRQDNLEIFADAIHASINEQLIQIYNSFFDFSLKYRVGIVGFGRRQQIRGLDRPLLLLVQLCFGLRRENLEIFADAIHASINEQLIHIYNCFFGF
ncbi:LOW QUALITY PROTEIN: hypothetical protein V1477_015583 [Vespula maculifrons]|uniref:Uncharacterized protein n=1 Tax=Vespula maculifrons TaxID=7453 RepID=A0ABD2BFA9_VESMC